MKKLFSLFALALVVQIANAQLIEPEYIGQGYIMTEGGEIISLCTEQPIVQDEIKSKTNTLVLRDGMSWANTKSTKQTSVELRGVASESTVWIKEGFSIVMRAEDNRYAPETKFRIVRLKPNVEQNNRSYKQADITCVVPYEAQRYADNLYILRFVTPQSGEFAIEQHNEMGVLMTFGVVYKTEDAWEYVHDFMKRFEGRTNVEFYEAEAFQPMIFDMQTDSYLREKEFRLKYGERFTDELFVAYKTLQKEANKAKKAQRKAKKSR